MGPGCSDELLTVSLQMYQFEVQTPLTAAHCPFLVKGIRWVEDETCVNAWNPDTRTIHTVAAEDSSFRAVNIFTGSDRFSVIGTVSTENLLVGPLGDFLVHPGSRRLWDPRFRFDLESPADSVLATLYDASRRNINRFVTAR